MPDPATIVGAIAAAASVASFTPQAWKIIRERHTQGLSAGMYALTAFGFLCWTVYGVLRGGWTIIIPNGISLLLSAFILAMILLPAGKTRAVAERLDPEK